MPRYEPYFSEETNGVQFEVGVNGNYVDAHVSQTLMAAYFGVTSDLRDWVSVYLAHRAELDACVRRRVQDHGRRIIIVRFRDLEPDFQLPKQLGWTSSRDGLPSSWESLR